MSQSHALSDDQVGCVFVSAFALWVCFAFSEYSITETMVAPVNRLRGSSAK